MINNRTYYAILQVDDSASGEMIESSYKRLSGLYQSGYSESGDARSRLRDLREAYAVLGNPDARLAYDARLRRRAALFDFPEEETPIEVQVSLVTTVSVEPRRGVLLDDRKPKQQMDAPMAWLTYARHRGGDICFKVDKAIDLHLVLSTLRSQVPEARRRYDPISQEWQVAAEYEPVLEKLFLNYSSLIASKQIMPTDVGHPTVKPVSVGPEHVPLPPRTAYPAQVSQPQRYGNRINWPPILITVLSIGLLYNLFLMFGASPAPAVDPTPTLDLLAIRPTPARLPTRTPTPVVLQAQPQYLSVHLRTGPGEEFDSLRYLYQDEVYQIIGRNQDGTWLQVAIRAVEETPEADPLALEPQSQALATSTPAVLVAEIGWTAAWVMEIQGDVARLPLAVTPGARVAPPPPPITPTP